MQDPSIRQIRTFLEVAQCRSFRKAAEKLATSQSNVTVQIRELEDRLNLQLFERTTRAVRLTRAGEALLLDFRKAADAIDDVKIHSAQTSMGETGRIVIGALPSIAAGVLPRAIADFGLSYPGVRIELVEDIEATLIKVTEQKHCDFALASDRVRTPALTFEALFDDDLVAILPHGHPLASLNEVTLERLASEALILMLRGSSLRMAVENAFAAEGLSIAPAMEVAYMTTAIGLAREGVGIAIIPRVVAEAHHDPRLLALPLKDQAGIRKMGIISLAGALESTVIQNFLTVLRRLCEARDRP